MGAAMCVPRTGLGQTGEDASRRTEHLQQVENFVSTHCLDCHTSDDPAGGFDLQKFDFDGKQFSDPGMQTEHWERMFLRLDTRQMPPPTAGRPDEAEYQRITASLDALLDERSRQFPRPGRVAALRRLTRVEYQNAIRDLLGIHIDAADFLPKDEASHGFDNITVEELSPTHLNRYLSAAQSISRMAVGGIGNGQFGVTIRQPADRSQEQHVAGLPFGTRGGLLIHQHFPQSGQYEIEIKLTRDRDEKVEGLDHKHSIDVLVDREKVHEFVVQPLKGQAGWEGNDYTHADSHLRTKIHIAAGEHKLGVTFPQNASSLAEIKRKPFDTNFNRHRHPRRTPAIYQVSIVGPFDAQGTGDTATRRAIFGSAYDPTTAQRSDAQRMLARLALRAYRRPVDEHDLQQLMAFFDAGQAEGGFEHGVELALTAILVNPNFLFRIEERSDETSAIAAQPVGDVELASRLSFFLWSSLPDDRLLELAEQGELHKDHVLEQEIQRMLADERSQALVENFASQWLYLRNLDSITPDLRLFPDFDDNLRQAFKSETQLLFQDILDRDRSILDLIGSKISYLNERLATHYGIAGVRGSHFRPVALPEDSHRGGILRHGSVLMVTSYATRTSPTIRGNWMLVNIFGTPTPPPPPNVPNLKESNTLAPATVRQRLAQHRDNPACASCHDLIDPIGFALENFDAVGRYREFDDTLAIDSRGSLPDGTELNSVDELEQGILARPSIFVRTLTEKLMTYALGRALVADDGPAIRRIVHESAVQDFKFSSIIHGIVFSDPFRKWSPAND